MSSDSRSLRYVALPNGNCYLVSQPFDSNGTANGEQVYVVAYKSSDHPWFFQNSLNHERGRLGKGDKELGFTTAAKFELSEKDVKFIALPMRERDKVVNELISDVPDLSAVAEFEAFLFLADIDKLELKDSLINPLRVAVGQEKWIDKSEKDNLR